MARKTGVFSWENEPSDGRRSEFKSTIASGWQHSTESTFSEPGRHERRLLRQRAREQARHDMLKRVAVLALLLLAVFALAGWQLVARLLER